MKKHTRAAFEWAENVVAGREVRGLYVRQACQRFLDDLERADFDFVYDMEEAEWRSGFMETLPHEKGRWAGDTLTLEPWQAFVVCNLFGWRRRSNNVRRFREAYIEVPRKNGKSLLAAAIAATLFVEGERGAEVYLGATTEEQAWEVFRPLRNFFVQTDELRQHFDVEVRARSLIIQSSGARVRPIIGKPKDGSSPSCAIVDEFHQHLTGDMVSSLRTGMGAREEPLLLITTTAGVDFGGPCREKRGEIIDILSEEIRGESTFGVIFTVDDDDRWDCEASLAKANPNWGISKNPDIILDEMDRARRSASEQNDFKTKHLDVWVGAKVGWMNMLALQRCINRDLRLEDYHGRRAFIGLDLSSHLDLTSLAILIPDNGKMIAFVENFLPWETVYGEQGSNPRYRAWAADDVLTVTPGKRIDDRLIVERIQMLHSTFEVPHIAYDPAHAQRLENDLDLLGIDVVPVKQTPVNFSEPMKVMEADITDQSFVYDGNPIVTWAFGNVVVRRTMADLIAPDKAKAENKIDPVVALSMAYALHIGAGEEMMDQGFIAL